jgi:hypothetical protein
VCQDIADSLGEGVGIGAIIMGFFKAFDLVSLDLLLMKLAASDVDSRMVIWIRELLVDCTQRVGARGSVVAKAPTGRGFDSRWCHIFR